MDSNSKVDRAVQLIGELSIDKASQVLSKLLKGGASIKLRQVVFMDITELSAQAGANNQEVLGASITLIGDAPFKFLFYVEKRDALVLTDMMLRRPVGTSTEMDSLVVSAVQEIGNILASAVTNVFSSDFRLSMKPSPPVVFADYATTFLEQMIIEAAEKTDRILVIESLFEVIKTEMNCFMYMVPLEGSETILKFSAGI